MQIFKQLKLFFLPCLFLLSCSAPHLPPTHYELVPGPEMTELITYYSTMIENDCGLEWDDSSVTVDEAGITRVELWYSTQQLFDLCTARQVLVDLVDGFLDMLNHHVILRDQLAVYPFTADQLRIFITCESFYGRYVDPMYMNQIRLFQGNATFYAFDSFDCHLKRWHHQTEPFETTRTIVYTRRAANLPYIEDEMRTGMKPKPEAQRFIYPYEGVK